MISCQRSSFARNVAALTARHTRNPVAYFLGPPQNRSGFRNSQACFAIALHASRSVFAPTPFLKAISAEWSPVRKTLLGNRRLRLRRRTQRAPVPSQPLPARPRHAPRRSAVRGEPDRPERRARFEGIASADALGNNDGKVTLEEWALVPLTDLQQNMTYVEGDAGVSVWTSLEDFIYLGTAPAISRLEEAGKCTRGLGDMRGG